MAKIKTPEEVKQEFDRLGISVAEWAREHGLDAPTVYRVLSGRVRSRIGNAHNAAVLLGLKEGTVRPSKRTACSASEAA